MKGINGINHIPGNVCAIARLYEQINTVVPEGHPMRNVKRPEPNADTMNGEEVKNLLTECYNRVKLVTKSPEFILFKLQKDEKVNAFLASSECPNWLVLPVKNEFSKKRDYEIAINFYAYLVTRYGLL